MSRAESNGWGDPVTVAFLGAAAVLLAGFVALQRRVAHPLLPLRVVTDRNRGGSYLAIGIAGAGIFGVFLFLTFYLQTTKGLSPFETGLAFLPMNLAIIFTATLVNTKVLARTGPRPLIPSGMVLASLGMVLLTGIGVDTAYASHVLPSLILIGVGFGLVVAPSFSTATLGVPRQDSGVASAMVSTSQQVGGSIGTALLSTLAVSATTDFIASNGPGAQAAVEGYITAFWWAAAIFAVGAIVTGALLRSGVKVPAHGAPEPVAA
jgi:sugar phosphate permease